MNNKYVDVYNNSFRIQDIGNQGFTRVNPHTCSKYSTLIDILSMVTEPYTKTPSFTVLTGPEYDRLEKIIAPIYYGASVTEQLKNLFYKAP